MIGHILRRFAGLPFKLERLDEAASGRVTGADLRAALPGLLRTGELAAVRKAWGEKLYYIPPERLPLLWEQVELAVMPPHDGGSVHLHKEAGPGLVLDLFRALTWIARNGLPMTSKGTIHQKSVGKLSAYLYLQDRDVAGLGLRYPHQEVYPPGLAVVLDLLQSLGLLTKERALWGLDSSRLTAWLDLEPEIMEAVLFRELLHRYVPDEAVIQHAVYRLTQRDFREGNWYALKDMYASLQTMGMTSEDLPDRVTEWIESWVDALSGFGWLDIGKNSKGSTLVRWRRKPQHELPEKTAEVDHIEDTAANYEEPARPSGVFFVQPDYEILVPPDVSYRIRWELEACCDNQTMDAMSVYRISKSSVARAAELGRTPDVVLELLKAHSATGVPENVSLALEQWAGEMGRIVLEEKLLLRCRDEEAAETVAALPALAGVLERIGPRDFIVDAGQDAKVRKALEEANLSLPKQRTAGTSGPEYPKLEEPGLTTVSDLLGGKSEERAWIFSGQNLHFYDRSDEVPGAEQLFAGLNDIPVMWRSEMRDYHASTARKMMSQAIAWKTKVSLRIDGTIMEFIPITLTGEEKWTVQGHLFSQVDGRDGVQGNLTELGPGQWESMRLMLPEMVAGNE